MKVEQIALGEIADVTKLAGFEFTKYIEYIPDGEIIALRALNLRNGELDLTDIKRIKKKVSEQLVRSKLYVHDILLTYTGNGYGDCAIIEENDKYHLAPNICKITPNTEKIHPYYLYLYIRSAPFYKQMSANMTGSGQPTIPMKTIRLLKIPVPPMEVQKKIACIVKDVDDKIRANKEINNNLLHQVSLLYEEVSANGVEATLADLIFEIESGSRPKGGAMDEGIPSIGAEKIERFGTYDYKGEKFISYDFFSKLKRGIVKSGDVLLYKDGAYTGKASMALDGFPHDLCAVNEHVFILRTKNKCHQFYLYACLAQKEIRQAIFSLAASKAAQPGLNQQELLTVKINLPCESDITNFENMVDPLMHLIASNALEIRHLINLRDTILPKLMSGEIDVSNLCC